MLDFKGISVHYGHQDVLTDVTFRVNKGDRVGVVGPNGSGKSTLFKIVLGEMSTDKGELVIECDPRIGFTRQNPEPDSPEETLLEYSLRGIPGLSEMEAEMAELESDLTDPAKMKRYGELQTKFEHLGGYDIETRVKIALGGLGFTVEEFSKPFTSFSGGWRMRAELSRVLASKPDLLLLDEPSNYLDLPAVDWLQKFLKAYDGTLMLISHDRYLLRTLTNIIVEVDAGTATRYEGDLDYYLREREVRYEHLKAAKENQDHHREQLQRFVDRFRAQATKAAQAQSRQKLIDKIDEARIVLPKRYTRSGRVRLPEPPPSGVEMVRLEGAGRGRRRDGRVRPARRGPRRIHFSRFALFAGHGLRAEAPVRGVARGTGADAGSDVLVVGLAPVPEDENGDERGGSVALFPRDVRHRLLRGKTRGIAFVHVERHRGKVRDAHFVKQLPPTRRLGGKNNSHNCPLFDNKLYNLIVILLLVLKWRGSSDSGRRCETRCR